MQKTLILIFLIGFSLKSWANLNKIPFQVGVLFAPSPNLAFNEGKISGNTIAETDLDTSSAKFDSVLGVRIAAFYPLADISWISLGGDLYGESSTKGTGSEDRICPRFVFANVGFGETDLFFLGGGLGHMGYRSEVIRDQISSKFESKLGVFLQAGATLRYRRFALEVFHRFLEHDIEGTVKVEGNKFNVKSKTKTNMTSLAITTPF